MVLKVISMASLEGTTPPASRNPLLVLPGESPTLIALSHQNHAMLS
jgi:hypothetical protein